MKTYDYKVKYLAGNVSQKDIDARKAGGIVATQLEDTINQMMESGYEYFNSTNVTVHIAQGCMAGANAQKSANWGVDIFRKEK